MLSVLGGKTALFETKPEGLGDVRRDDADSERCDELCARRRKASYPAGCSGRCSRVLRPNEEHVEKLLSGVKAWNEWRSANPGIRPNLSGLHLYAGFKTDASGDYFEMTDLSGIDLRRAVMRGSKIRHFKMEASKFDGADLRCSEWFGVNATGSSFLLTDLRNATISDSNLHGCQANSAKTSGLKLDAVRLSHANLRTVDLRDSSLESSDLSSADLSYAHLCGATLAGSNLTRTNLYGTRVWRTRLFNVEDIVHFSDTGKINTRTIYDLASLFQVLSEVRGYKQAESDLDVWKSIESIPHLPSTELFYRGHNAAGWCLNPTIARKEAHLHNEADMMDQLLSKHPEEFRQDSVFFQRLVRARHFELPSRLLDVTSDAQTALYYATDPTRPVEDGFVQIFIVEPGMVYPFDSDTVSVVSNFSRLSYEQQRTLLTESDVGQSASKTRTDMERNWTQSPYSSAMKRLIHFIAREKPYWEDRIRPVDLFKVLLVKPEFSFPRLKAHDGAFLMSAYHNSFDPTVVNAKVPGSGKYRRVVLRVPSHAKIPIRRELRLAGVTEESLRADLGSTATAISDAILAGEVP